MVDACREHGVKLQIAFPMRFSPPVVALREAVRGGRDRHAADGAGDQPRPQARRLVRRSRPRGGRRGDGPHRPRRRYAALDLRRARSPRSTPRSTRASTPARRLTTSGCSCSASTAASRPASTPVGRGPKTWPTWGGVTMDVIGDQGVLRSTPSTRTCSFSTTPGRYALVPYAGGATRRWSAPSSMPSATTPRHP